ncbi:Arylsulfotransferase [Botryosphaeria dothidea]|uniref:Arylsulfotransferase n=1 Tax=Botryosphaeria dothidea TaxID=55169 RepID=A0A8H4ITC8_9PEZI|nr:Arylsulfotransferase [Botryosphaeria dothidea]
MLRIQQVPEGTATSSSRGFFRGFNLGFTPKGDRVLDIAFADTEALIYRTAKSPWKGWPRSNPDLYIYALNESNPSHFYISWNGATEISAWNVYASEGEGGENIILEKVDKRGFETHFEARMHVAAGLVEGLDKGGHVLGRYQTIFQDYATTIQRAHAKEPDLKDILDEIRQIVAQSPPKASTPPITTKITLHLSEPATREAVALLSNQAIIQKIQAGKSFASGLGQEIRPNQQLYSVLHPTGAEQVATSKPTDYQAGLAKKEAP